MADDPTPMTPITSSMLQGAHYDPATRALTVEFKGGTRYRYDDVTAEKAEALVSNQSPGSYFGSRIKGLHPATKL